MTTPLALLLLALFVSSTSCSRVDTSPGKHVFISNPWYGDTIHADPAWLASMLSNLTGVDTLEVRRFIPANLDDDPSNEYLMVIDTCRRPERVPHRFLAIDSTVSGFKILMDQPVWDTSQEGPPKIGVFGDTISFPVFYVGQYNARGSGAYFYYFKTFRLADGKVYEGPEIVSESELDVAASDVNQIVEGHVTQTSTDNITATFRYSFFPNYYALDTLKRTGRCPKNPPSTIDDSATVIYRWNASQHTFVADYVDGKLSDAKMECLMELGADDKFRSAFRAELEELARTGNDCQRAMAEYFLKGNEQ